MYKLKDLIDDDSKGWGHVEDWISKATNKVEVLTSEIDDSEEELTNLLVSTETPMGAIVYETGGILVDHGWIRLFGASNGDKMERSLSIWNKGRTLVAFGEKPPFLLVADDVLGGSYAINCGGLGDDYGQMYYFAFDTLEWEPLEIDYSEFVWWTFTGDLEEYYGDYRWEGWQKDVEALHGDQAFDFDPFLSIDGAPVEERKRTVVTAAALYSRHIGEL